MRLSVFALVCLFLTACATREKGRERISFNKEWRFALTEKQANAVEWGGTGNTSNCLKATREK